VQSRDIAGTEAESIADVMKAIKDLTAHFDNRFDSLEARLLDKMKGMIGSEVTKAKEEFDSKLQDVNKRLAHFEDSVSRDNDNIKADITGLQRSYADVTKSDNTPLNVVIKNIAETSNENVMMKVNGVIREGLKLRGVEVAQAVRKISHHSRYPGVIIATCK